VRPRYIIAVLLTALWCVLVWHYVEREVGWDNLFFMLPTEIALFFGAVAVPPAFVWLIVAYVGLVRVQAVNRQTVFDLAADIAEGTESAENRIGALAETFDKRLEDLTVLAKQADQARAEVAGAISVSGAEIGRATTEASAQAEKLRGIYDAFVDDLDRLGQDAASKVEAAFENTAVGKLASQLERTLETLENRADNLRDAAKAFAERIEDAEGMLDSHRLALTEATQRATAQAGEMRSAFSNQAQELAEAAESASQYMERLREAIDTQVAMLQSAGVDLNDQSGRLESALTKQAEALEQASSRTVERAAALEEIIQKRINALRANVDDGQAELAAAADKLASRLADATTRLSESMSASGQDLSSTLTTLVTEQAERLKVVADEAEKRLAAVGETMRAIGDETVEAETVRIEAAAKEAGKKIEALAAKVAETVSEALNLQVGEVHKATEQINADLALINRTMKDAAAEMAGSIKSSAAEAQEASDFFRGQARELADATKAAAKETESVREAVVQGRREAFLLGAAAIIKELGELAVDIDKVFEPKVPDNVVKLYDEGDVSIFIRRIVRTRDAYSIPLVRERMRKDAGFRRSVETYIKRYEALLSQTAQCDPDRILTATFLTADIGKVYMLLARAVQKD